MSNRKRETWKNSTAKELLAANILSGAVPASMESRQVYEMREEYSSFRFKNFSANLESLRMDIARSQRDYIAFLHDMAIVNERRKALSQNPGIPPKQNASSKMTRTNGKPLKTEEN